MTLRSILLGMCTFFFSDLKDQPRVRFGRTFAEVSDKECPKVRFGGFLAMPQFGLSLITTYYVCIANAMHFCIMHKFYLIGLIICI